MRMMRPFQGRLERHPIGYQGVGLRSYGLT
jgi:hypothetical protein